MTRMEQHFYFFVVILLQFNTGTQADGIAPWAILPDVTKELCPNVCVWRNENLTNTGSGQDGLHCSECSCEPDCGFDESCCFVELAERNGALTYKSCTYAATPYEGLADDIQSYYMIDQNPETGCLIHEHDDTSAESCGDAAVAPWGSLYPVTSTATGKIYRNEKCALCHNDTDYVKWAVYQACIPDNLGSDLYYITHLMDIRTVNNYFNNRCIYAFIAFGSNGLKDRCYKSLIDYCPTDFDIPRSINLTRTEIIDACTSGFQSPVKEHANIFCWVCSNNSSTESNLNKPPVGQRIMFLLDDEKLATLLNHDTQQQLEHNPTTACMVQSGKADMDCVPVLCPTGQMKFGNECDFLANRWLHLTYGLILRLIPVDGNINASSINTTINYLWEKEMPEVNRNIRSHWADHWRISDIYYYVPFTNSTDVWHLLVFMTYTVYEIDPNQLLYEIKTNLHAGTWKISTASIDIEFTQEFPNYSPFQDNILQSNDQPGEYVFINGVYTDSSSLVIIKKLFFCEQVRIHQDNFNPSRLFRLFYYDKVFYKPTGMDLSMNEFIIEVSNDYTNVTVRICLGDSGYELYNRTSVRPFDMSSGKKNFSLRSIVIGDSLAVFIFIIWHLTLSMFYI